MFAELVENVTIFIRGYIEDCHLNRSDVINKGTFAAASSTIAIPSGVRNCFLLL